MQRSRGEPVQDDYLGLAGELIDYHAKWQPVSNANVVFDVVDKLTP
jgi:hypothetical protein